MDYVEASCYKIDPINKKVFCRSTQKGKSGELDEFEVEYDYLVVAMGARSNTFNIPGVEENAHFLKVPDNNYLICRELDPFPFERVLTSSDGNCFRKLKMLKGSAGV